MIKISQTQRVTGTQLAALFASADNVDSQTDPKRLQRMIDNANLFYTAGDKQKLVGVARGFSDQAYCCYISELMVRKGYQHREIIRQLLATIHHDLGSGISLVIQADANIKSELKLLGFEMVDSGFEV